MKVFYLLLILILSSNGFSQAREFEVKFDKNCFSKDNGLHSDVFNIAVGDSIPFVGISAFIAEEGIDTRLFYRIKQNGEWKEWREMNKFTEGATPGRTAFEGEPLQERADSIQFKSSRELEENVVFRLFFPMEKKKMR